MRPAFTLVVCSLVCAGCAQAEELSPLFFPPPTGVGGSSNSSSSSGGASGVTSGTGSTGNASTGSGGAGTAVGSGGAGVGAGGSGGAAQDASIADAGRGGSAGGGGSTTGVGGSVDAAPPTRGFSVLYRVVGPQAMANAIQCELTINDPGPDTAPLSELSLRYYFTNEIVGMPIIDIGFSGLNPGFHDLVSAETKQVVPVSNPTFTADSFVEFGFTAGAGSIAPGQSVIISWQYHGLNFPPLTQSNDYSFDPTKTAAAPWDHVVLVRGGNVIWGTPP
jgi:hypothetical protein